MAKVETPERHAYLVAYRRAYRAAHRERIAEIQRASRKRTRAAYRATHPRVYRAGTEIPIAKLTDAKVLAIRARRAAGQTLASLAAEFCVSPATIASAACGETWAHLPGAVPRSGYPRCGNHWRARTRSSGSGDAAP